MACSWGYREPAEITARVIEFADQWAVEVDHDGETVRYYAATLDEAVTAALRLYRDWQPKPPARFTSA